jgi:hypothetical protein
MAEPDAEGSPPVPDSASPDDPKAARRAWRALPRTRRRALEVRGVAPEDAAEARAVLARGHHLRSLYGALEWVLGGAAGVLIAVALQYGLSGDLAWDVPQVLSFIAIFGLVGVVLRRWRGRQLVERGRAALSGADRHTGGGERDDDPSDGPDREFGPPPADG